MREKIIIIDKVNHNSGKKKVAIFLGRFSPPTLAHIKIIKQSRLPVRLFIVSGKTQETNKNPFSVETKKKIFKRCLHNVDMYEVTSGFIGELIHILRNKNEEPIEFYCGSDRLETYQAQLNRYKDKLNLTLKLKEIKRTDEDISASKVRDALRANDFETFKKMTDSKIWDMFEELKKEITK